MEDPVIFLNFVNNICNVTVARARNKILGFIPNFRVLMTTPESQNDELKNTHSSNSAQGANAKILIPSDAIIYLKSIQFELEDRRKCNTLPNLIQLAPINDKDFVSKGHKPWKKNYNADKSLCHISQFQNPMAKTMTTS